MANEYAKPLPETGRLGHAEVIEFMDPASQPSSLQPFLTDGLGRRASRADVEDYLAHLREAGVSCEVVHAGRADGLPACVCRLIIPGRSAMLMLPPHATSADEWAWLIRQVTLDSARRGLLFTQALLEPNGHEAARLLALGGFQRLTRLIYLERQSHYPWVDGPEPEAAEWVEFSAATRDLFVRTLAETYQDSADCPELSRLRTPEDALESHRAAGRFNPGLWNLARMNGRIAGCLLLAEIAHGAALDVVYMGVTPSCRRRGIGTLLLRRALAQCRARGIRRLSLAVDSRNASALGLYARFAFTRLAERVVYISAGTA